MKIKSKIFVKKDRKGISLYQKPLNELSDWVLGTKSPLEFTKVI